MRTVDELWELLEQGRRMPHGAAQIATIEQVLRHTEEAGDPDLSFATRMIATNAYVYGGEPAKAFVTFSWCLSDFDKNPGDHHKRFAHTLLWHFKYMINALTQFPEIPLDRTYAVLDDMERRYREGGHSLQAVYKHRYAVARHVGATADADQWFGKWQAAPRDELSDCEGCDPTRVASHLNSRERYADAVALAEPVLSGRLTCSEQPQAILSELMIAYVRTGELAKAADAHRRSYRAMRGNLADLWDIGGHIEFCARTGNEHRGLELLQRHVDWLDKAPSPAAEMNFSADAALLLRRLTEQGHGELIVRRRDHDDITAAELATELAGRATALAARFDARNGTAHQGEQIAEKISAEPYAEGLVLSPAARTEAAPVAAAPEPEPVAEVPAGLSAAELLDLAREHSREDREADLAETLAELARRFGALDDPLLNGRELVLRGDALQHAEPWNSAGVLDLWGRAVTLFERAGAEEPLVVLRSRIALLTAESGNDVDDAPIVAEVAYQGEHGGPVDRAAAYGRLCSVRYLQERHDESAEASESAQRWARESGRLRLVALTSLLHARTLLALDRPEQAQRAGLDAWQYYRVNGPAARRAEVALVCAQMLDDEPETQVELYGITLAAGQPGPALAARVGRGRALIRLERAPEAVADLLEAVAICDEREHPEGSALSRQELAEAYRLSGRPVEAAEVAEEALLRLERLGFEEPANDVRFLIAGLSRQLDDVAGALEIYRDLVERLAGNPAGRGHVGEQLAGLLYDVDRDTEAAMAFRAAAADLHDAGDLIGELRALRRLVGALHYADDPEAAEEAARRIAERFDALPPELAEVPNAVWQRAMTAFETGRLRMSRGNFAEAVPDLRDAVGRLRELGASSDADRLEGMLGEALLRSGSVAEAEELLRTLLDRLPEDAPDRQIAVDVHAEAVEALKSEA